MAGEQLGQAILDLDVDLKPFDRGLDTAKAHAAATVATIQAMFDRLQANVDLNVRGMEKVAAAQEAMRGLGGASAGGGSLPSAGGAARGMTQNEMQRGGMSGVRGSEMPGSRQNPVVVVLEASKYTPLGSMAAAIGESDQTDATRTGGSALSDASDLQGIRAQLSELTQTLASQNQPSSTVATSVPSASTSSSQPSESDAATLAALQSAADSLSRLRGDFAAQRQQVLSRPTQTSTTSRRDLVPVDAAGRSTSSRMGNATSPIPVVVENRAGSGPASYAAAGGGSGMRRGEGAGDAAAGGAGGAGSGGGGGGRFGVSGSFPEGGGGGGGHGSRFQWNPLSGSRSNSDRDTSGPFSLANILKGDGGRGGAFGLPGFGSIGSLAGLGLEHWILSALGVGASATSAIGGAALLGTASLTKSVVGGGSDLLINKDTESQIKAAYTSYQALQQAVSQYGASSKQAAAAQATLNQSIAAMGGGQAAQAEMQVVKNLHAMTTEFQADSNQARAEAAQGMDNLVHLATTYVPLVTQAAATNLGLINTGLKPLFSWLEGPQGIGIFNSLENSFASGLPTSIHALDMALEDFLRLMQATLPYTGGLSQDLDNFFTDKNKEGAAEYDAEVQKLVGDLREWEALLKVLGEDMSGIFSADAGTANSIVQSLTQMLVKLHDWEESSQGQADLKNIFAVHKTEILQLLQLLPELLSGYGKFYLEVAPPLVKALSGIAGAVTDIAKAVESLPGGADLLGLSLVLGKLGMLGPGLKGTAVALGLMTGAEEKNAPAAAADAAANRGLGGSLGATAAGNTIREGENLTGDAEGGAATAGAFKAGSILDKIAQSGANPFNQARLTSAAATGAVTAETAGYSGLADAITGAGTAVAPLAAGLLPVLAAAGGAAGLILLFKALSGQSDSYGNTIAKNVAKTLNISPDQTGALAQHLNTAHSDQQIAHSAAAQPGAARGVRFDPATQIAQANQQYQQAGQSAVTGFIAGVKSAKYPSGGLVWDQMEGALQQLPAKARGSAAQTMLAYTQALQQDKELPAGTVKQMIGLIEGEFPALSSYLKQEGLDNAQDFAKDMSLTEAVSNTKSAVTNIQNEFGETLFPSVKLTSSNLLSTVTSDFKTLQSNMGNLTGQGKTVALQNMAQLKQTALSDATAMEQSVSLKIGMMGDKIQSGSASAAQSAIASFNSLAGGIGGAMAAGLLATNQGSTLIAEALNQELKALGAKTIPLVTLKAMTPGELLGEQKYLTQGQAGTVSKHGNFAGGGLLQIGAPGQGGRDSVPFSVNGTPIMVAPGEQLAVFNRHQLPIVNSALAPMGGLPGLFNSVQTPNYMAQGGLMDGSGHITAPSVAGAGAIAAVTSAALQQMTKAANAAASKYAPTGGGGGKGMVTSTAGLSGSLVQIVHELAQKFGWSGQIQDWLNVITRESGGSMTALNGGSGAYGIAQFINGPGEYAQYGGNVNTMSGQLLAMANYIKQRYGDPAAAWQSELTRGWYATGGLPLGLASGAASTLGSSMSPSEQAFVQSAKGKPHHPAAKASRAAGLKNVTGGVANSGAVGQGGPFPFAGTDLNVINGMLGGIFGADGGDSNGIGAGSGGDAEKWWNLVNWNTGTYWTSGLFPTPNFSSIASPGDFVITQDQYGNAVTPYISQNINEVVQQLTQAIGWQGHGVQDLNVALHLTQELPNRIQDAINRRKAMIAQIQKRIQDNAAKIKALLKKISDARSQIQGLNGKNLPYPKASTKAQRLANQSFIMQRDSQINGLNGNILSWQQAIKPLQSENQMLGGDKDQVGTAGEIGQITQQLGSSGSSATAIGVAEGGGNSTSGLYQLLGTVQGWESQLGGVGGDYATQNLTLRQWQQNLAGLIPGADGSLAAAASSAASSSASNSTLTGLLEQQNQMLAEQYAVSQAQYKVLANLPPFAGTFHTGGVIPGPLGQERLALVQSGETITPAGAGGMAAAPNVHVHIDRKSDLDRLIDVRIENAGRRQGRQVRKSLPGQGGGLVPAGR